LLGLALGFVALMRWQLVTYAILPLAEMFLNRRSNIRSLLALGLGAAIAFAPQMIGWKIVYGNWLVITHTLAKNWFAPNISEVLLSPTHGFFTWTPITALAFLGTTLTARRQWPPRLVLAGFAIQLYLIGVVSGPGVFLGLAYGLRYLTEALVVLAPGFALLLARPKLEPWLIRLGILLVLWNMLLITAFRNPRSQLEPWSNSIELLNLTLLRGE
jgi:hypothetical protein